MVDIILRISAGEEEGLQLAKRQGITAQPCRLFDMVHLDCENARRQLLVWSGVRVLWEFKQSLQTPGCTPLANFRCSGSAVITAARTRKCRHEHVHVLYMVYKSECGIYDLHSVSSSGAARHA